MKASGADLHLFSRTGSWGSILPVALSNQVQDVNSQCIYN